MIYKRLASTNESEEKKKITDILKEKEKFETDKKIIDTFYSDDIKKEIEKRYRKDFQIDKIKEMMNEKCIIELDKNSFRFKTRLKGNPLALLFTLYLLEDYIKKEYAIPEPLADIIKLIKNDEYRTEVHNVND